MQAIQQHTSPGGALDYMSVNQLHEFFRLLKHAIEEDMPEDPLDYIHEFICKVGKPRVVMKGAPASGKGTQCEQLVKALGAVHVSTGDLLRDEIAKGSRLGLQAKDAMLKGELVPDSLVIDLVKNRLNDSDVEKRGWILDGFPRTPAQAKLMLEEGISPDCVIQLRVPDDVIVQRVEGRRIDPLTKKVYNIHSKPPPQGVKVVQRPDDTKEAIVARLATYHHNLQPMLECYTCPVFPVQGKDAEDVSQQILMAYQKLRWSAMSRRSML